MLNNNTTPRGSGGLQPKLQFRYDFANPLVEQVLERARTEAQIVKAAYAEGDLRVATFRSPRGTVVGAWQQATP